MGSSYFFVGVVYGTLVELVIFVLRLNSSELCTTTRLFVKFVASTHVLVLYTLTVAINYHVS